MYDPQLGRWNRKDPLMEWHFNYSPYAYCFNNPISFIDPFGLDTVHVNSDKPIKKDDVVVMDDGSNITSSTDAVYCYGPKPEKKGFWGFMFFVDGYSDGSESLARKVSWDRVLGFIDISFLQDMFDAFWRGNELHKKIKDTNEKMAGKGIKRASQIHDSEMNPNNTTNGDGEEINEQGQPKNRVYYIEQGYTQDGKYKTVTTFRYDTVIYKVINGPGDTNIYKEKNLLQPYSK
jgi:hypothetical protein